jgi:hypothetical protein
MTTVLDVLQRDLEEVIESYKDSVAYGHAKDYAEYRHSTGVITGLTSALQRVKDLQNYDEDD